MPSSGRLGPFYNSTERTEIYYLLLCKDVFAISGSFFLNNKINNRIKKLMSLYKKLYSHSYVLPEWVLFILVTSVSAQKWGPPIQYT